MKPEKVKSLYLSTLDDNLRESLKVALELIKIVEDNGCTVQEIDPFASFVGRPNEMEIDCTDGNGDYNVDRAFACAAAMDAYIEKLEGQFLSEEEYKNLFNN